jgi:hypothetical protein
MTEDDNLRSRLRRADPAAALAPLTPDETSRLLEETMTTTIVPPRVTTGRRRRLPVLIAAALVLLAAAGASWLLTRSTPPAINTLKPSVTVVSLTVAGGGQRKCAEPTAEILAAGTDFAFAGTVTGIAGDVVTLSVTHVYKGAKADEVRVRQAPGRSEEMLGSGRFETGQKYLVASSEGGVLTCGYSGEADSLGLRELYEKAF